ncbi:MAG TPA: ABC transporter permease [Verrucomicrobiae bacterium]
MIAYRVLRIVQLGIKSLLLHKMRSALTMLGIIFGVCSVIAMLAIGEGASYEAQETIKKLGSNNVIIRSVKPPEETSSSGGGSGRRSFVSEHGITYKDAGRIQGTIPGVASVLPMRIIRDNVIFDQNNIQVQVIGTHPNYPEMTGAKMIRGRFLSSTDESRQANVCVITLSLAQHLFPYQNPLDEEVRIGADYYQVVGLLQEQGTDKQRAQSGNVEGQALDSNVYIPLATARSRFGDVVVNRSAGSFSAEKVELHQLTVQFHDPKAVEAAVPQIEALFGRFHKRKDFEFIVPLQLLRQAEQTKRIFNIVLGSIAAISLLVGGIGIMNIMLATVTERTREIGVRRALGAKKKDIITQFLVETVVLSFGGGLIGVMAGVIIPLLVSHFTDMKAIITWWSVVLAFSISGLIGVVFGIYPASSAANLDPIDALRHE